MPKIPITLFDVNNPIKDKTNVSKKYDVYEPNVIPFKTNLVVVKAYNLNGDLINEHHTKNLVVTVGRSWLMQKAFDTEYDSSNPVSHEFLAWFSVGKGGATGTSASDVIAPNDSDTDLFNRVQFGTDPATYADGGYKKNFTSLTYTDTTTAKLILTVDHTEANDSVINELGLFASNSSDPAAATEYVLFAHTTFPSIPKNTGTLITFEWYFLF